MEARTNKDCCPVCGADRLNVTAGKDHGDNLIEYPCSCDVCGWEGLIVYKDNYFIGHLSAAGVVAVTLT